MTGLEREQELLSPKQVAAMFCVSSKTVARWADQGLLTQVRTLGGYDAEEVFVLLAERSIPGSPGARS